MNKSGEIILKILEGRASIIKSPGQPARLQLLSQLKDGEHSVCRIFPAVDQGQANVSKHLSILRLSGILEFRKDGLRIPYRIKTTEFFKLLQRISGLFMTRASEKHLITGF